MDLENVHKYVSLRKKVSGVVEALYSGQVFAFVTESSDGGATAYVNPVFMKLVCGAETIFDIPAPCVADSIEEAIADCIQNLHGLNCFKEYDTEFEDTAATVVAESVSEDDVVEEETLEEAEVPVSKIHAIIANTKTAEHGVKEVMRVLKVSEPEARKHVNRAMDDAMKEDTEQVDEISKATLGSYINKAAQDIKIKGMIAKDYENRAKMKKKPEIVDYNNTVAQNFKQAAWTRQDKIAKAVDRLTKEETSVEEGYTLQKTGVKKYTNDNDVKVKDTDYKIVHNKTGQEVGQASMSTDNYFGKGALRVKMKNGAERDLPVGDRSDPQSAFNKFAKNTKTSSKYKSEDIEGKFDSILEAYHAAAKKGLKEKLVGNQHKLDINKDGKIDATDLHKVRQGHVKENLPPAVIVAADRAAGSDADPKNVNKKPVAHATQKIVTKD